MQLGKSISKLIN